MFNYCAYTQKGSGKNANDDRVMIDKKLMMKPYCSGASTNPFMAVICDGVGSTVGGALAAEMTAKSFKDFNCSYTTPTAFGHHLKTVNAEILRKQKSDTSIATMASTAAGIVISNSRYVLFNLGDTRIYKYYDNKLRRITRDHTTEEHTEYGKKGANVITRYLGGYGNACYPSYSKGIAEDGSLFLLCSDGVYKGITEQEITYILEFDWSIAEKGKAILKRSLQNGSTDDMSLVIVKCAS